MESVTEIWKPVKGFEGMYEVSSMGRIKSLERKTTQARACGRVEVKVSGGYMTLATNQDGYHQVRLCGKPKIVHRLVLEAFIGQRPDGHEACHHNGIRKDNRLENLRWDTQKANMADRDRHGRTRRGDENGQAKLTHSQAALIASSFEPSSILSKAFGISTRQVRNIRSGKKWAHLREGSA